jgi:hypothetical protein
MSHWDPALRSLQDSSDNLYGPESFIGYLRDTDQDPNQYRTAAELSIDTRTELSNRLQEEDTMVLRLGRAPDRPGTQFALVNAANTLDDFFINESEFTPVNRQTLDYSSGGDDALDLQQSAKDMLEVYRTLPTFSETSFVNFALSTGIVSQALDLDSEQIGTAPTTVASTFDFRYEPHPEHPSVVHHNSGQIEIDALIMTRRNGKRILLVIEAKRGSPLDLAKHKLAYPAIAAKTSLSLAVDHIIPVYIRANSIDDMMRYSIYECSDVPAGEAKPSLAGLQVVDDHHYEVIINQSGSQQQRLT